MKYTPLASFGWEILKNLMGNEVNYERNQKQFKSKI